jgi:hypothetical protein
MGDCKQRTKRAQCLEEGYNQIDVDLASKQTNQSHVCDTADNGRCAGRCSSCYHQQICIPAPILNLRDPCIRVLTPT